MRQSLRSTSGGRQKPRKCGIMKAMLSGKRQMLSNTKDEPSSININLDQQKNQQ